MKVDLFVTCLCDLFYPEVGEAVVRVLRRLGCEVRFPPEQTCCGQPAFNSGYEEEARAVARRLIEAFSAGEDAGVPVVAPSGSCAAMVRHHYPRLFAGDARWEERARRFAGRVFELSEFIVRRLGCGDLGAEAGARLEGSAVYHRSCHMSRGLGVVDEPLRLLRSIQGLEVADMPNAEDCCGFGGTFAVKMPDISVAMADRKVDAVEQAGAAMLVGSDLGCLMQIGGRLRRRGRPVEVLHTAQVFDRAMAGGGR
ncbi:MAG TPA: (Fe-S)-binding protein [Bacillota bacterium]